MRRKSSGVILFTLLLAYLLTTLSCRQETFSLDSVTTYDLVVYTAAEGVELVQQGLGITIDSPDISKGEQYQIRLSSEDGFYQWERVLVGRDSGSLIFNDLLMPGNTPFPSGDYELEVINPSGIDSKVTVSVKSREMQPFESPEIDFSSGEKNRRMAVSLPENMKWYATLSFDPASSPASVSSGSPVFPSDGGEVASLVLTYWDESRRVMVVYRARY